MKKTFYLIFIAALFSCTKQEFQTNKASSSSSISEVESGSTKLCSSMTLIKPKVDILLLWDNSSSFNFVTSETKTSMTNLISSVSEKFDYHVLNAPLVPANTTSMYEMSLIASDAASISGSATSILKTKDQAISTLSFSTGIGSREQGIDRAYDIITTNRSNGIFRDGAYTIIVLLSNEDDKGCELTTGYSSCTQTDKNNYLSARKQKMLCLRGNTNTYDCSSYPTLNSTMMRWITVAPLTACDSGFNKINYNYKTMSKFLYESSYNNGWPTSNDDFSPDIAGYPDSRNLCTVSFSHIFDSVNSAIKQTLINHVYSYWPVAGTNDSVDPDTITVTRDDGKVLVNKTNESNPTSGFAYIGNQTNHSTRSFPTAGEPFTGKMIQLFGTNNNDLIVYPKCLTVKYKKVTTNYGYIYLTNGEPLLSTMEVYINGTLIPQSSTNGWSYMGKQDISSLDQNFKVANLPASAANGYIIQLNGNAKVSNSTSITFTVNYTSKSSN